MKPVASSKKMKAPKSYAESLEALEGLDTLANLAILGEGEGPQASSQATTKHPRHRPGCSCIVCIQPPSGKGPKHKQSCTCNVCSTVKRRFKTLMMKREKKQSEKEADITRKKQQQPSTEKLLDDEPSHSSKTGSSSPDEKKVVVSEGSDDDPNRMKTSSSPFKGQIDLNIQPEREEELSPGSDSGSLMRMLQDPERLIARQQKLSSPDGKSNSAGIQLLANGGTSEKVANGIVFGSSRQDTDKDNPSALPIKVSASSPPAG